MNSSNYLHVRQCLLGCVPETIENCLDMRLLPSTESMHAETRTVHADSLPKTEAMRRTNLTPHRVALALGNLQPVILDFPGALPPAPTARCGRVSVV